MSLSQPSLLELPALQDRSALDELFSRAAAYRSSAAYVELLQFIAKFTRYSPFNCFLLHMQNPEVTYVATPKQWHTRFGRNVKRDARPLIILAPRSPVIFVYDLMDTEGRELPERFQSPFETRGQITQKTWNFIYRNCLRDRIPIITKPYSQLHAGTASRFAEPISARKLDPDFDDPTAPDFSTQFLIEIGQQLDLPARYATLVHELGHIYSGHLGTNPEKWWPSRMGQTHQQKEIEAESIAFLVCRRRGLNTKSDEYMANYVNHEFELPVFSLETILRVVNLIETMSEQMLPERKNKPAFNET